MWSDELRSRWPLSPCEPCAWILLWSSVLFIFDQIILEHFRDVVFFYEIRCSMEMQYLIRHRFETPSTWIGTSVNLICTALTHFLIQDCTILSGDVIIRYLAEELKPDFVVFLVSNILCNESILISWFHFTFHTTWAKCQFNTGCDILRQCFCAS